VSAPVWIGVALLGGAGAILRFLLDGAIGSRVRTSFPLGTFAINISGSLVLGLFSGLALSGDALVLAGTATLGSYTTFSTWMLESQRLTEDAQGSVAIVNVVLSLAVGIGAAAVGHAIGVSS
jgi:fluoride exporter